MSHQVYSSDEQMEQIYSDAGIITKKNFCTQDRLRKATFLSEDKEVKIYDGTTKLRSCNSLSLNHIEKLYIRGTRQADVIDSWDPFVAKACCSNEVKESELSACIDAKKKLAASCESMAYILSKYERKWNDEEHYKKQKTENAPRMPTTGANGAAATAVLGSSSIKCESEGVETVDYESCRKFVTTLETINVVQATGYQVQDLAYKVKASDLSTKYMNEQNAATGALKVQSDSLKMQEEVYQQRTAIDTVKLGYLYSIYKDLPKTEDVMSHCKSIQPISSQGVNVTPTGCVATVRSGGFAFIMNSKQIDAMKTKLVEIATQAGSSAILASLMGKRAGDIDNAIAKIEDFKPIDPVIVTEDEARSSFCNLNPGHANCLTAGLNRTFDTIDGNIINFGGSGLGTNYDSRTNPTDFGPTGSSGGGSSSGDSVTPIGSVITAAAKDNTIEGSSGANVKTSGAGSTGGGGGGGGGSGAGGGSGGGGAPSAGDKGGVSAAIAGAVPKYEGGGGGISVVGGMGIRGNKKEGGSEENPFGKLFGKDAPKNAGVVNFREVASVGKKGDNLFDMISKRYNTVTADKRLLEYELAK